MLMHKTDRLYSKKISQTFVQQHDRSDCGVACLLSIIKYYGGSDSLENLRELSGTTKRGTTLLGLFQTANKLGFNAEGNEADIQALIDHKTPVILHVLIDGKLQHYIVCYGFRDEKFIIGDPAEGIVLLTREQLIEIWISKTCLTLIPNNNFIKIETKTKNKKKWILGLLKEDTRLISFSLFLGLFIALLGMAMAVFSQKLVDDILPSKDFNKLIIGILLVAFLLIIRVFFTALRDYFLVRQTRDFNKRIIDSFFSSLLHLPKPFFDTRKIGELVARLNDTQRIQRVISMIVGNTAINILVTFVSLGFLFYYSWQTGLIALISLPIYFSLVFTFNKTIISSQKEVMSSYAYSESNYITSIQGISVIKNNNRQSIFRRINQLIYGNYQEKTFDLGKIRIRLSLYSGLFNVFFLVGILIYTSIQVFNDNMLVGELMAVIGIAGSLLPSVASLALITIPLNEAQVAFDRMYEFASLDKENTGKSEIKEFYQLEVQNLSFRFAGRSQLLKKLNLSVRKGKISAIVGESGSGKSTLGEILQKFYDFEDGEIIINNKSSIRNVELYSWRNIVGVVPQDIIIFNGNVIDNILLGKEDSPDNVVTFCQEYGIEEFIKDFPQGYATILGEEGINLSGGQKQIIALTRALYKKPQLLILDEATSAMDRKTEKFCIKLISKLKDNMGVLFISHRLETLRRNVDTIYILDNGTISEKGSHEELLKSNNFYSEYWRENFS